MLGSSYNITNLSCWHLVSFIQLDTQVGANTKKIVSPISNHYVDSLEHTLEQLKNDVQSQVTEARARTKQQKQPEVMLVESPTAIMAATSVEPRNRLLPINNATAIATKSSVLPTLMVVPPSLNHACNQSVSHLNFEETKPSASLGINMTIMPTNHHQDHRNSMDTLAMGGTTSSMLSVSTDTKIIEPPSAGNTTTSLEESNRLLPMITTITTTTATESSVSLEMIDMPPTTPCHARNQSLHILNSVVSKQTTSLGSDPNISTAALDIGTTITASCSLVSTDRECMKPLTGSMGATAVEKRNRLLSINNITTANKSSSSLEMIDMLPTTPHHASNQSAHVLNAAAREPPAISKGSIMLPSTHQVDSSTATLDIGKNITETSTMSAFTFKETIEPSTASMTSARLLPVNKMSTASESVSLEMMGRTPTSPLHGCNSDAGESLASVSMGFFIIPTTNPQALSLSETLHAASEEHSDVSFGSRCSAGSLSSLDLSEIIADATATQAKLVSEADAAMLKLQPDVETMSDIELTSAARASVLFDADMSMMLNATNTFTVSKISSRDGVPSFKVNLASKRSGFTKWWPSSSSPRKAKRKSKCAALSEDRHHSYKGVTPDGKLARCLGENKTAADQFK